MNMKKIVLVASLMVGMAAVPVQALDIWASLNFTQHMLYDRAREFCENIFAWPHDFYKAHEFRRDAKQLEKFANIAYVQSKDLNSYKKDCAKIADLRQNGREKTAQGLGHLAKSCLNLVPFYLMYGKTSIPLQHRPAAVVLATAGINLVKAKGDLTGAILGTCSNVTKNEFLVEWECGVRGRAFMTALGIALNEVPEKKDNNKQ